MLIRWVRCTDVTVRDVHLLHPGAWTLNLALSKKAVIENVTIDCRDSRLRNNDGIDIDSCEDVQIRHCNVASEDDAIVIKATSEGRPSRDIVAADCTLSSGASAIKLGTESIGGFDKISISNCHVVNTDATGIALYEVDGGGLRSVDIDGVTMDGVAVPICVRLGARLATFREGEKRKARPGSLRDVTIQNVTAKNVKQIGMLISGVPGFPIEALTLENIKIDVPGGNNDPEQNVDLPERERAYPEIHMFGQTMPAYGMYVRHVNGIAMKNVQINALRPDARPANVFVDVAGDTTQN